MPEEKCWLKDMIEKREEAEFISEQLRENSQSAFYIHICDGPFEPRVSGYIARRGQTTRKTRELKKDAKRREKEEEEQDPDAQIEKDLQRKKDRERKTSQAWLDASRDAEALLARFAVRSDVPAGVRIQMNTIIATLHDQHAKPSDRRKAADDIAALEAEYGEERQQAHREAAKQEELDQMSIPDIIQALKGNQRAEG